MNTLDKVIEAISPTWGAHRKAARMAIQLAAFPESQSTRVSREVTGRGASADWNLELGHDRRNLVDRARELERDNALASALLDRSVEAIIGEEGFKLHAQGTNDNWNKKAEDLWNNWCQNEADVRGINTFTEIMEITYRSKLRDGDVGVVLMADGCLRTVESDEISFLTSYSTPTNADGVEMDANGRPIAYHIMTPDPNILWADRRFVTKRTRVPAENFIFLANRTRAGQTRGITTFNGIFDILEQIDGTVEAVTMAAHMAACFGLVIKKDGPLWGLQQTTDSAGNATNKFRMEPASVVRLAPGESIEQVKPNAVSSTMEPHVRLLMRLAGTRFGIPLEVVLCDYSPSNFSNTRAALLQTFRKWSREQAGMARFASRIRNWKTLQWIEEGKLAYNPDALKHSWTKPGWKWIDPMAEIQGALAEIDAGISTREEICARSGKDFKANIVKLAEEQKDLEAANIGIVRSKLTREPGPTVDEQLELAEASKPEPTSPEATKAFWEGFWKGSPNRA